MSTFDEWQEKAAASLERRHFAAARKYAKDIQEYAGYIIRSLDDGEIPHYSLVEDANNLARRVAALESLRDLTEIHKATPPTGGTDTNE